MPSPHVVAQAAGVPAHFQPPPAGQAAPHAPQLLTVVSAVSQPGALVQFPNPVLHEPRVQVPVWQLELALGNVQVTPHPPQFVLVLIGVSQPSVSGDAAVQFAKVAAQALVPVGTTQPPVALQETVAPLLRWARAVQSCPQVPQFVGSFLLLTHLEPHRSGFGATQLEAHVTPPEVEQSAVGALQTLLQLPQLIGCVRSVSQPLFGLVEQCPVPLTHAEGWSTHAPAVHCTAGGTEPCFTLGNELQSWPQLPQFL